MSYVLSLNPPIALWRETQSEGSWPCEDTGKKKGVEVPLAGWELLRAPGD